MHPSFACRKQFVESIVYVTAPVSKMMQSMPIQSLYCKNWVYFSFCKRFNVFLRRISFNKLLGLVLLSRFNFWMVISLVLVHLDTLFDDVFLLLSNFLFPCKPFILCNVKKKSVLLPFFFQYQFPVVLQTLHLYLQDRGSYVVGLYTLWYSSILGIPTSLFSVWMKLWALCPFIHYLMIYNIQIYPYP